MLVTITGSEGIVGGVLRQGLAARYELRALTRTPQFPENAIADVTDMERLQDAVTGSDAVIHLAAAAALDAPWPDILESNIQGTRNVYEAARLAGVRTVVFASSGHVTGLEEDRIGPDLYSLDNPQIFDERAPYAPDSLYAISKVFGETLGRFYAETYGLRVICVRLGTVLPDDDPLSSYAGQGRSASLSSEARFARIRAKWLSHRDCCELFACCIEATSVNFAIVYGTSNNPRQIWSLNGARALGYQPQDSAPLEPRE
jgi:nucleoside-diphosphate-sugar epimerase